MQYSVSELQVVGRDEFVAVESIKYRATLVLASLCKQTAVVIIEK